MKIYKQYYDSYGDILFENYFTSKTLCHKYRNGKHIAPKPDDDNWVIEEINVIDGNGV